MDPDTIDQTYAQLQQQATQTSQLIQTLAGKLQGADAAGDPHAREWLLDLKEVTLGVQQQQNETSLLLESIHAMVGNHLQQTSVSVPQPQYQQPQYQQGPYQQSPMMGGGAGGGGMLQRFLGGGMGRAIVTGAGFGIGDDLINKLF